MSNLISQYGADWFNSKFQSTLFSYEGIPARVAEASSTGRGAKRVHSVDVFLYPKNRPVAHKKLSADYFKDSSVFSVPELGYRHTDDGVTLLLLSRNNHSYTRGLSLRNLSLQASNHSLYLRAALGLPAFTAASIREDRKIRMALSPNFIPMRKGIELILKGKLASFAVSPSVAVVASPTGAQVLVAEKAVGSIDLDGTMTLTNLRATSFIGELYDNVE